MDTIPSLSQTLGLAAQARDLKRKRSEATLLGADGAVGSTSEEIPAVA